MELAARCQPIRLILSDVDGVLTDGTLLVDERGVEAKRFHIRDGMGIRLWQEAGHRFGLLTHRKSKAVKKRAAELGVFLFRQGVEDKLAEVQRILGQLKLTPQQTCYLGDDLLDLAAVSHVGLGVAVADACEELRRTAHYVTALPGGAGAVRETIEMILKAQRRWEELVSLYATAGLDRGGDQDG